MEASQLIYFVNQLSSFYIKQNTARNYQSVFAKSMDVKIPDSRKFVDYIAVIL